MEKRIAQRTVVQKLLFHIGHRRAAAQTLGAVIFRFCNQFDPVTKAVRMLCDAPNQCTSAKFCFIQALQFLLAGSAGILPGYAALNRSAAKCSKFLPAENTKSIVTHMYPLSYSILPY